MLWNTDMLEQSDCKNCSDGNGCKDVYSKLGKNKGPSVALKATLAFVVPIIVFICVLAGSDHLLAGAVQAAQLRSAVSFVAAVAVTLAVILIIKLVTGHFSKNR